MRHAIGWIITMLGSIFAAMASTAGAISGPFTAPQDFTAGGGVTTVPLLASTVAALTNGSQLLATGPGRLQKVLVTALGAQSWTFYDAPAVAGSYTGKTIVGFIPASAAAGLVVSFQMPTLQGIVAVPSATGASALTVSFT